MQVKTCTKCGYEKPVLEFKKAKRGKYGVTGQCKKCISIYNRKYLKIYYESNKEKIRQGQKHYYLENNESIKRKVSEYQFSNERNIKKRRKLYRQKESYKQCMKKYRLDNADKIKRKEKEYREKNRDRYNYHNSVRQAQKIKARPEWFEKEKVQKIYTMSKNLNLEVDHIVPLQSDIVCGLHCWDNLQLLNRQENLSKSNRYWPNM